MGYEMTESVSQGTGEDAAENHTMRKYTPKNAHKELSKYNDIDLIPLYGGCKTYKEAFDAVFAEDVIAFNAKQKRKDRRIGSYYDKCVESARVTPIRTFVNQYGNKDTASTKLLLEAERGDEAAREKLEAIIAALRESTYDMKKMLEDTGHFIVLGAQLHADESTFHVHMEVVPISTDFKGGMQRRASFNKACKQAFGADQFGLKVMQEKMMGVMEASGKQHGIERVMGTEPKRPRIKTREFVEQQRQAEELKKQNEAVKQETAVLEENINQRTEAIRDREEKVQARESYVDMADRMQKVATKKVEQREQNVANREDDVAKREEAVSGREKSVMADKTNIANQERKNASKALELETLSEALNKRDKDVQRRERHVALYEADAERVRSDADSYSKSVRAEADEAHKRAQKHEAETSKHEREAASVLDDAKRDAALAVAQAQYEASLEMNDLQAEAYAELEAKREEQLTELEANLANSKDLPSDEAVMTGVAWVSDRYKRKAKANREKGNDDWAKFYEQESTRILDDAKRERQNYPERWQKHVRAAFNRAKQVVLEIVEWFGRAKLTLEEKARLEERQRYEEDRRALGYSNESKGLFSNAQNSWESSGKSDEREFE